MTPPPTAAWRCAACLLLPLLAAAPVQARTQERLGTLLSWAMPAATFGYELARGDSQGARQYATSFGASMLATYTLQRTTHVERPDRSDHQSFPSGHAARAFSAAAYVHRRHGVDAAWPLYLAALYVGHTRVVANSHRWGDVAGAALVSAAAAWWLVDPAAGRAIAVLPDVGRRHVAVQLRASW